MNRQIRTAGGAAVIAAGAGVLALLTTWEPDPRDPGLVYADKLAGGLVRGLLSTPISPDWSPLPFLIALARDIGARLAYWPCGSYFHRPSP